MYNKFLIDCLKLFANGEYLPMYVQKRQTKQIGKIEMKISFKVEVNQLKRVSFLLFNALSYRRKKENG